MWASLAVTLLYNQGSTIPLAHNHPASNFPTRAMTGERCSKAGLAEQVTRRLHPHAERVPAHIQHPLFPNSQENTQMWEQSSLAEQGAMAELQGKQRAQEIEGVTATTGGIWKHCPLCLRNGRAQIQFRLKRKGKKQKNNIKGNKKIFYCCPSSTRLEIRQQISSDVSRGTRDAFCASPHQHSPTGSSLGKELPEKGQWMNAEPGTDWSELVPVTPMGE